MLCYVMLSLRFLLPLFPCFYFSTTKYIISPLHKIIKKMSPISLAKNINTSYLIVVGNASRWWATQVDGGKRKSMVGNASRWCQKSVGCGQRKSMVSNLLNRLLMRRASAPITPDKMTSQLGFFFFLSRTKVQD